MLRKIIAGGIAAAAASLAVAGPASAMTTHYFQVTDNFSCTGQVLEDGDGGTMYVDVSGYEQRLQDRHFRVNTIATRLIAQEKDYNGVWRNVEWGRVFHGYLGATVDHGANNTSPFVWATKKWASDNPTLWISVNGYDDLFRVKTVTRLYDDEGVRLARLVTVNGSCRL
jgi:hypothetical protein